MSNVKSGLVIIKLEIEAALVTIKGSKRYAKKYLFQGICDIELEIE